MSFGVTQQRFTDNLTGLEYVNVDSYLPGLLTKLLHNEAGTPALRGIGGWPEAL